VEPSQLSRSEDLVRRYSQAVHRLAWSHIHNPSEGEDLFQEIAIALWTALPRFRGESSERTWVYRVAHNTAISHLAGIKRRTTRELTVAPSQEPAAAGNSETKALDRERRQRLWDAIRELPLQDRQIVVLHLEGLSAAEIEEVTGLSQGNVATRLTRIRQRLAAKVRRAEVRG
jgi:RNA polymerase sigma-70 factor (ECF subfamily)